MTDTPVKVGVVGVGSLGQWHARVYSELDATELVGVCDADPERAREIAERYGTRMFESIVDLAEAVDAASVAVPTPDHAAVAEILIGKQVHVLVEKPITDNTEDAARLVALAREAQVVLQVGHVERFNPVLHFLEEHLETPRFIEAIRLAPFPPARAGQVPRGTDVSVVLDLMIHDLEIILHLVRSEVSSVHAIGVPVLTSSEDIANARIVFESGCVANVTASRVSHEHMRKVRLFQPDSYVSLDYQSQEGKLYRKKDGRILPVEVPIEKGEPLANQLSAFVDCARHRSEPRVSGHHGFAALALATEICRLIAEGQTQ